MKIAICDDNKCLILSLIKYLEEYQFKTAVQIDTYTSGRQLISSLKDTALYDIVFMDIRLQKESGISAAKIIKELYPNILLIFISSYEQYYKDISNVESFGFLSKPFVERKVNTMLDKAIRRISGINQKYHFQRNGSIYAVSVNEILYVFSTHRKITFKLLDGSEEMFYAKLDLVYSQLSVIYPYFARPNKSYVVNLLYIKQMSPGHIKVGDLDISRSKKYDAEFIHAYLDFICT